MEGTTIVVPKGKTVNTPGSVNSTESQLNTVLLVIPMNLNRIFKNTHMVLKQIRVAVPHILLRFPRCLFYSMIAP
jgi:hypothetical protein